MRKAIPFFISQAVTLFGSLGIAIWALKQPESKIVGVKLLLLYDLIL